LPPDMSRSNKPKCTPSLKRRSPHSSPVSSKSDSALTSQASQGAQAVGRKNDQQDDSRNGSEKQGRWNEEEHRLFLQGVEKFGKDWKQISTVVLTRTVVQIRTHAQKYFLKLEKKQRAIQPSSLHHQTSGAVPNIQATYEDQAPSRKRAKVKVLDLPAANYPGGSVVHYQHLESSPTSVAEDPSLQQYPEYQCPPPEENEGEFGHLYSAGYYGAEGQWQGSMEQGYWSNSTSSGWDSESSTNSIYSQKHEHHQHPSTAQQFHQQPISFQQYMLLAEQSAGQRGMDEQVDSDFFFDTLQLLIGQEEDI